MMATDKRRGQEQSGKRASRSVPLHTTQSGGFMGRKKLGFAGVCVHFLYLRNRRVFQLCGDTVMQL